MAALAIDLNDMGDMGFTERDREVMVRLQVQMEHIMEAQRDTLVRLGKLEERAVSTNDMEQILADIDDLREKKADRKDLSDTRVSDHEARLRMLEKRQWLYMGGAYVLGILIEALFHLKG